MSQGERIRTPWKRRWERFRQRVLPLASFVGSVSPSGVAVEGTGGTAGWSR